MQFDPPLVKAKFIRRYKRFFADITEIPGGSPESVEVAHVANTGSMLSVLQEGVPCLVQRSKNPERKLKWSLMAIQTPSAWVGVNTALPNLLVKEAFEAGLIWQDKKHWSIKSEVKISDKSRIDLVLSLNSKSHFIEVKNVTLGRSFNGKMFSQFPDAVTERGQKHIDELVAISERGDGAELVFVVQRNDGEKFSLADDIDPVYAKKLRAAVKKGVHVRAFLVDLSPEEFRISGQELQLDLIGV